MVSRGLVIAVIVAASVAAPSYAVADSNDGTPPVRLRVGLRPTLGAMQVGGHSYFNIGVHVFAAHRVHERTRAIVHLESVMIQRSLDDEEYLNGHTYRASLGLEHPVWGIYGNGVTGEALVSAGLTRELTQWEERGYFTRNGAWLGIAFAGTLGRPGDSNKSFLRGAGAGFSYSLRFMVAEGVPDADPLLAQEITPSSPSMRQLDMGFLFSLGFVFGRN
jgi:hypothetical protein